MKRLLLLTAVLACTGPLVAGRSKSAADFFIEFNTMEEKHKNDWFKHDAQLHDKKMKLLESQHHDWVSLKNKHLKHMQQTMTDCSKEAKDAKIAGHLDDAISLHKKHKKEWKNWSDWIQGDMKKIAERHDQQLAKFEDKYRKEYKEEQPMSIMMEEGKE
jgi:hypothetical protein